MVNIYDTANQLANDLRETQQFLALKEAMDAVKADEDSLALFKELDAAQMEIMEAQQTGKELTEEQQDDFKSLKERVSQNTTLQSMLLAEQAVYTLLNDVQKNIGQPLSEAYEDLRKA
ncbi:YlbF family regulator [Lactobacillus delbrueckii]|uniref:YlbF family regulator n=1 Tax=Lactobacillus delbrueckii TaxID=1584 RepID=UPI0011CA19BE|nr:YlbF family regulator [Lactobacillus delbrueckii]TXG06979.1 YlbF family regulator [Lactobacillus delbrueckii subsp. bulgaricus]